MQGASPTPETTLAILLGATEFPKQPQLTPSKAFLKSANDLKNYFLSPQGLALPAQNVLDLFDSNQPAAVIDEELALFLERRQSDLKTQELEAQDIIVYYVGHGGFSSPGNEYFLAIRATRAGNEYMTSYAITALANTLREHASFMRKYLILDSCFSAAAQASFQSAPLEVAKQQTLAEFPKKGTALLCAAGPKDPANSLPGQVHTMFSGALLDCLQKGSLDKPERLSLFDVGELTRSLIKERFPDKAVRPELHSPDQKQGDVVVLPFFPNVARRHKDVLDRLEEALTGIAKRQGELEKRYETLEKFVRESKAQSAISLPQTTNWDSEYRYGVRLQQWQLMPLEVKAAIAFRFHSRPLGRYWLTLCVAVCISVSFLVSLFDAYLAIQIFGLTVCGFMTLISYIALWWTRTRLRERWIPGPWDDLDTVISIRKESPPILVFGFKIAAKHFMLSTILYTATLCSLFVFTMTRGFSSSPIH
jgi:uncharacterized metal-binding protein